MDTSLISPSPSPCHGASHQLQRCPPWENGVWQSVWDEEGRGRLTGAWYGGRGRLIWTIGAVSAQMYSLKSERPVHLPRKVWRVRHLGHSRDLPDLTSSVTSYQVHIFLSDFGDRDSPEEERRSQSAGGICRAWMMGKKGSICLQIE